MKSCSLNNTIMERNLVKFLTQGNVYEKLRSAKRIAAELQNEKLYE